MQKPCTIYFNGCWDKTDRHECRWRWSASRLKNKRRKSSLGLVGAGSVRRHDVSKSRSRLVIRKSYPLFPTCIPFRGTKTVGRIIFWGRNLIGFTRTTGKLARLGNICARSLHADTLLKDTANPWFGSITPVTEFITTCRPNARIESEYEV